MQAWPGGPGASGKTFVFGGGTMVAIPRGSKKQPAAWEFLKFVGSKDGGYLVQKRTSDVSGHREAANMPEIVTKNLGRKEVLPYFEKTNALSYVDSPAGPGVTTALASAQTRILKHDGASKDILADALQQAQQALDDYWSRHA
jgi:ABC-type glycerol-3-phosphate transport system substrate-binding protein